MQAMRTPIVLFVLASALLGGCSTTGSIGTNAADAGHASALKPAMPPVGHNLVHDGVDPAPVSVEPMPFGQHPFGPWSVWPEPAHRGMSQAYPARAVLLGDINQVGEFNKWGDDKPFAVRGDIHTVMHYIGLRSDLQIIVEGSIEGRLGEGFTVDPATVLPLQVIWRICKALDLDMVVDDKFVILNAARWWPGSGITLDAEHGQRFSGGFVDTDASAAIMETCKVAGIQVYIPSLPEGSQGSLFGTVRFEFKNCTPDTILRKIAEQAGLNVEVKDGAYLFSRPEPTRKG